MKAKDLITILEKNPEMEVFCLANLKGMHSLCSSAIPMLEALCPSWKMGRARPFKDGLK